LKPWQPKHIEPPQVDPELPHLDCLTRSAESIRYSLLSIEFWISPNGQVREWLRHNARVASWLAVPAFLVLPLVVLILFQAVKAVVMLTSIAGHMVVLPILALVAAVVILVVVSIARAIFR
jgi:uncharacterized membrane protein YphA (DoxX/SURF4 family)